MSSSNSHEIELEQSIPGTIEELDEQINLLGQFTTLLSEKIDSRIEQRSKRRSWSPSEVFKRATQPERSKIEKDVLMRSRINSVRDRIRTLRTSIIPLCGNRYIDSFDKRNPDRSSTRIDYEAFRQRRRANLDSCRTRLIIINDRFLVVSLEPHKDVNRDLWPA